MAAIAHTIRHEQRIYGSGHDDAGVSMLQIGYFGPKLDPTDAEWLRHFLSVAGGELSESRLSILLFADAALKKRLTSLRSWRGLESVGQTPIVSGLTYLVGQLDILEMNTDLLAKIWSERAEDVVIIYLGLPVHERAIDYGRVFEEDYLPTTGALRLERVTDGRLISVSSRRLHWPELRVIVESMDVKGMGRVAVSLEDWQAR